MRKILKNTIALIFLINLFVGLGLTKTAFADDFEYERVAGGFASYYSDQGAKCDGNQVVKISTGEVLSNGSCDVLGYPIVCTTVDNKVGCYTKIKISTAQVPAPVPEPPPPPPATTTNTAVDFQFSCQGNNLITKDAAQPGSPTVGSFNCSEVEDLICLPADNANSVARCGTPAIVNNPSSGTKFSCDGNTLVIETDKIVRIDCQAGYECRVSNNVTSCFGRVVTTPATTTVTTTRGTIAPQETTTVEPVTNNCGVKTCIYSQGDTCYQGTCVDPDNCGFNNNCEFVDGCSTGGVVPCGTSSAPTAQKESQEGNDQPARSCKSATAGSISPDQAKCVLNLRKDILPFYKGIGWCDGESDYSGIVNDWMSTNSSKDKESVASCLGKAKKRTTAYRFAETPVGLETARWHDYAAGGVTYPQTYTFTSKDPGVKTIFVQFQYVDENGETKVTNRYTKSITLVAATPTPPPSSASPSPTATPPARSGSVRLTATSSVEGNVTENAVCHVTWGPINIGISGNIPAGATVQIRTDNTVCGADGSGNPCSKSGWTAVKTYSQAQTNDNFTWNHGSACLTAGNHTFGLFDKDIALLSTNASLLIQKQAPSGGSSNTCSRHNGNCGNCLKESACAYGDGKCVVINPNDPKVVNCPAGNNSYYWYDCSTNQCVGGSENNE